MSNPDTRKNILSIGAVVLPVIAVKIATIMLGHSSATTALAAPRPAVIDGATASSHAERARLTPRQMAAAKYVETSYSTPFGRTPMLFAPAPQVPSTTPVVSVSTPVQDTHPSEPLPSFTLNAVMSSSTGQRAVINGTPYLVGDVVKNTDWVIHSIRVDERSATLGDTKSGRTVVIAVDIPQ